MAHLLDLDTGTYAPGAANADWLPRAPGWVVVEHKFPSGVTLTNTDCIVFFKNPWTHLRVADWFVIAEQFDTNGAPALVVNVGTLNSSSAPTALSTTWLSSSDIGRAANQSMIRSTDGKSAIGRGSGLSDIGIHIGTVPATQPSLTGKKVIMGCLFVPW